MTDQDTRDVEAERDSWLVHDTGNDKYHVCETRSDVEEKEQLAADIGIPIDVYPPGEHPEDDESTDGGQPVPDPQDAEPAPDPDPEPAVVETSVQNVETVSETPSPPVTDAEGDLPERSIAEDPLTWVPGEFVDEIDGTQAINRKGFEVLSHFYDIGVQASVKVAPEDTDHEYCRVKATATTPDGRTCEAFGSAHVDRGDDNYLLLEMADTRARKRALSIATGVGAVAVAELRNELEGGR